MSERETHVWKVIQGWFDKQAFPPSQRRFAIAVGVSPQAISGWRYGSRPTSENLKALATIMEPTLGPKIYDQLVYAVNQDQGYY